MFYTNTVSLGPQCRHLLVGNALIFFSGWTRLRVYVAELRHQPLSNAQSPALGTGARVLLVGRAVADVGIRVEPRITRPAVAFGVGVVGQQLGGKATRRRSAHWRRTQLRCTTRARDRANVAAADFLGQLPPSLSTIVMRETARLSRVQRGRSTALDTWPFCISHAVSHRAVSKAFQTQWRRPTWRFQSVSNAVAPSDLPFPKRFEHEGAIEGGVPKPFSPQTVVASGSASRSRDAAPGRRHNLSDTTVVIVTLGDLSVPSETLGKQA